MSKDGRRSLRAVSLKKDVWQSSKLNYGPCPLLRRLSTWAFYFCSSFFPLFIILSTVYIISNKTITLSREYFQIENCLQLHDNRTASTISPLFWSFTIMSLYAALFSFGVFAWSRLYAIVSSFVIVSTLLRHCLSKNVSVILVENEVYAKKPVAYMN